MTAAPTAGRRTGSGLIVGAALAAAFSAGPMLGGTISLLILPVSDEFGWARSIFPMAIMIAACAGALAAPLAGRFIDRYGARLVMLVGLVVLGGAHGLLALSDGGLAYTFGAYAVLGAASSFSGTLGITRVVSAAFDSRRGRALGLTVGVGAGLGAALIPLLTGAALALGGWRSAYVLLGAAVWAIAIPAVWLLFPRGRARAAPVQSDLSQEGLSPRAAMRTREFWLLGAILVFNALAVGALTGHWAPFQAERGVSAAAAAALLSGFGLVKVVAQLGGGWLLDRLQTPRIALLFLGPVVAGAFVFATATGPAAMAAGALLFGLGEGAELGLLPYMLGRYVGLRRFGEVMGWLMAANILASGLANVAMGALFDLTGSYQTGLMLICGTVTLAVVAAALLGPYRFRLPGQALDT